MLESSTFSTSSRQRRTDLPAWQLSWSGHGGAGRGSQQDSFHFTPPQTPGKANRLKRPRPTQADTDRLWRTMGHSLQHSKAAGVVGGLSLKGRKVRFCALAVQIPHTPFPEPDYRALQEGVARKRARVTGGHRDTDVSLCFAVSLSVHEATDRDAETAEGHSDRRDTSSRLRIARWDNEGLHATGVALHASPLLRPAPRRRRLPALSGLDRFLGDEHRSPDHERDPSGHSAPRATCPG
jgi:hypothetical protein